MLSLEEMLEEIDYFDEGENCDDCGTKKPGKDEEPDPFEESDDLDDYDEDDDKTLEEMLQEIEESDDLDDDDEDKDDDVEESFVLINLDTESLLEFEDLMLPFDQRQVHFEAAKFDIFPRFRTLSSKYSELKKLDKDIKAAEELLNNNGIAYNNGQYELLKIITNITNIFFDITDVLQLASCNSLLGIPLYLINRLLTYLNDANAFDAADKTALNTINQLNKLKKKPGINKKTKDECDKQIRKLKETREMMNDRSKNFLESSTYEYYSIDDLIF